MKTIIVGGVLCLAMGMGTAQAGTVITFDNVENPNIYRTPDGMYYVEAFSADVNTLDLVHGAPPPSIGIPVPYSTLSPMDMGISVTHRTIGTEFHWDEAALFGDPTYGTEYWVHGRDFDGKDVFLVHTIVQGVQIVTTPKADAEIAALWILAKPAATSTTRIGRYGAVDNIKLRAKGEKLPEVCAKRRKC